MQAHRIILFASFMIFAGCARAPIKSVDESMRLSTPPTKLQDDLLLSELAASLRANIERLKSYGDPLQVMRFGPQTTTKEKYILSLEKLIRSLEADPSGGLFYKTVRDEFDFHEVYGNDKGWGEVFITSYFEPQIQGRVKPSEPYTEPLYSMPRDIISIKMGEFAQAFPILQPYQDFVLEKSRDGVLRGRLVEDSVVPYYSRAEISDEGKIKKSADVIVYVDPIDAFFLQIQGSGQVLLPNGKVLRVGYAGQNGYPYSAIGKQLFDVIPKEQMSSHKIEMHLRSLPKTEAQAIMNTNASYIFFQEQERAAVTYFGTEAVAGRTIATDPKYFPKGAVGFLQFDKVSRFVLDQDTGGAIRGPGRVDLFWGRGTEAGLISGAIRNPGRLYYLFPKITALN